jgi:chemotaxis protein CheX
MARPKANKPQKKMGAKRSPPRKARAAHTKKQARKTGPATDLTSMQPASSAIVALPETLDSSSAVSLKEQLLAKRGAPLVVDAGQVRRTGMQAVQVLLSAARTWRSEGQSYAVANASEEFLETLALVGLPREHLLIEGTLG